MTIENVKAFYKRLADNEVFRTQIKTAGSKQKCSQIAQQAGFYFTQEEFEEFTAQLLNANANAGANSEELSETELEAAAGGANAFLLDQKINPGQPYGLPPYLFYK